MAAKYERFQERRAEERATYGGSGAGGGGGDGCFKCGESGHFSRECPKGGGSGGGRMGGMGGGGRMGGGRMGGGWGNGGW